MDTPSNNPALELQQQIVHASAERDEFRDLLQRVAADFENYKRRTARERDQNTAVAQTQILRQLLDVIDDVERAQAQVRAAEQPGLAALHARLTALVISHGLTRILTVGQAFDPKLHEALMTQPAPNGIAAHAVLRELQSGWKTGDRVMRHARVIVSEGG